jgi:Flp pilus assembly protein TadD
MVRTQFGICKLCLEDCSLFLGALAVVLIAENKPKEAESTLRRALRIEPQDSSLRYNLGRVLQKLGDAAGASQEFHEASRLKNEAQDKGQVGMLVQNGINALRGGEISDAVLQLKQALALDPNHSETNYTSGLRCRR